MSLEKNKECIFPDQLMSGGGIRGRGMVRLRGSKEIFQGIGKLLGTQKQNQLAKRKFTKTYWLKAN